MPDPVRIVSPNGFPIFDPEPLVTPPTVNGVSKTELDRVENLLRTRLDTIQTNMGNLSDAVSSDINILGTQFNAQKSKVDQLGSNLIDVNQKVEGIQIPDITGLAQKTEVKTLFDKVDAMVMPDVSGLAPKSELTALSNKVDAIKVPDISGKADKSSLSALAASIPTMDAIRSDILADDPPVTEAMAAAAGSAMKATRRDHVHKRISETFEGVTDGNGKNTITFEQTYKKKPAVVPQSVDAGIAIFWDIKYIGAEGAYTGITITARKGKLLPTQSTGLTLLSALTAVISALNDLASKLSGLNLFNEVATNIAFTGFVLRSSKE